MITFTARQTEETIFVHVSFRNTYPLKTTLPSAVVFHRPLSCFDSKRPRVPETERQVLLLTQAYLDTYFSVEDSYFQPNEQR